MERFWIFVDKFWVKMASVKFTMVLFLGLVLLSVPGTVVLQYNISNVDPGLQYDYDFWQFGKWTQLFSAYHSVWYVGLIVLLSVNLIACSEQRWPQMWKLATAKAKALSLDSFKKLPKNRSFHFKTKKDADEFISSVTKNLKSKWITPEIVETGDGVKQIFWQTGRWSRLANYVVHTSLLIIFAGAIYSAIRGFEGAANIPEGAAVDTILIFNEGRASPLKKIDMEGALPNERLLGFRVQNESFEVSFYEDFPGRPKDFVSKLNFIENGEIKKTAYARVNDPVEYNGIYFYQASYGSLGDYTVGMRIVDKQNPLNSQVYLRTKLGKPEEIPMLDKTLVVLRANTNVEGLGPGALVQEMKNDQAFGKPFWVLKDYPEFDLNQRSNSNYTVVLDQLDEKYFTGLQVGHDPGAWIYWIGSIFMILGTFYALFVQHKKFYLRVENGEVNFAATINRLPLGFEKQLQKLVEEIKGVA